MWWDMFITDDLLDVVRILAERAEIYFGIDEYVLIEQ